jgi:Vitamin K-dependent gamma-carboxylase
MKRIFSWWNKVWFSECDPLPAAVCRIAVGLLMLYSFTGMSQNWERFFAPEGSLSLIDLDLAERRPNYGWNIFAWTENTLPTMAWWYIAYATIIALIVGFQTRIATILFFIILSSIIHRNPIVVNGEDMVVRLLLLYGMFSPWGEALSVDSLLKLYYRPNSVRRSFPVWAIRLMQVNIMLIYVISLPYKFAQDIGWLTGDALHWTVSGDMWWMRGFLPEITLAFGGLIRKMLTWGTVLIEGLVPLGVCFRRTQHLAVLAMMSLHFGIALLVPGVTLFTLSMVAASTLYIPPTTYRAIARWFTSKATYANAWQTESLLASSR